MRRWKQLAVVSMIIMTPVLPQLPSWIGAYSSKSGVVLNKDTGEPMAGVWVLATGRITASALIMGSSQNASIYRVIVRTREDGTYTVPSLWHKIVIGTPGTHPSTKWTIAALKLGYAMAGDEGAWTFDERGFPYNQPQAFHGSPQATWNGFGMRVAPILLGQAQMNLKESALYYSVIAGRAYRYKPVADATELQFINAMQEYFVPQICKSNEKGTVDSLTAHGLMSFSLNTVETSKRLMELEPDESRKDQYDKASIRLASVCAAIVKTKKHQ